MRHSTPAVLILTALLAGCGPSLADCTRLMHDASSADARREGIADAVTHYDEARTPSYTELYHRLATSDPDPAVRAMAVRALNVCRDRSATAIFIAALGDRSEAVRLEGAKALANVPDPNAVPALLKLLAGERPSPGGGGNDANAGGGGMGRRGRNSYNMPDPVESRDVRIAAADALRRYPTRDVEQALTDHLADPDFGLAWQAHQSLVELIGQDRRYDPAAWGPLLARS